MMMILDPSFPFLEAQHLKPASSDLRCELWAELGSVGCQTV